VEQKYPATRVTEVFDRSRVTVFGELTLALKRPLPAEFRVRRVVSRRQPPSKRSAEIADASTHVPKFDQSSAQVNHG
jgi:hypothetical protein